MSHDVFISYSNRDKAAADAVCHALEAEGIRCWIAPRDIPPGQPWKPQIVQAIRDGRVMVLIFSGQANRSPQVKREVDIAFESDHPIVPFRIEDVKMADEMYYCLAAAHWLDALSGPLDAHMGALLDAVRLLIPLDEGAEGRDALRAPAALGTAAEARSRSTPPGVGSDPPAAEVRARARRWLFPTGMVGLLLMASLAFGLSQRAVAPAGEGSTARAGPEVGSPDPLERGAIALETGGPGGEPAPSGVAAVATPSPAAQVTSSPAAPAAAVPESSGPPAEVTVSPSSDATPGVAGSIGAESGVLVVIYGNDAGGAAQAEAEVLRSLLSFPAMRAIDANSLALIRGQQNAVEAANRGDFVTLAGIGREHGVEYLVVGTLNAGATPSVNRFFTGSAEIDIKMYRVSSGTLIGAEVLRSETGGSLAASEAEARSRAAGEASRRAASTVRMWANRANP